MREILFRGKKLDGEWVYGDFVNDCSGKNTKSDKAIMNNIGKHQVIPETVGQYTGLTDKNGKKIFEGDIVTMPAYLGGRHKAVVYFKNGKFAVDGSHYYFKDIAPKNMEVIGNIHDNPKLLEAE